MALVMKFAVSGMNAAKYSDVLKELEKKGAGAPQGRLYHVSYGSPDSLQVIDVWEDEKSFKAFGEKLMPVLQERGIQAPPEIFPVHKIIKG